MKKIIITFILCISVLFSYSQSPQEWFNLGKKISEKAFSKNLPRSLEVVTLETELKLNFFITKYDYALNIEGISIDDIGVEININCRRRDEISKLNYTNIESVEKRIKSMPTGWIKEDGKIYLRDQQKIHKIYETLLKLSSE